MENLYIIDASGYLYRSYHAIQNLTNEKGESTNAIFGFIRSLLKLKKDFHPDHLVAVFDGPKGTEKRKALYPEYKAQRAAMPEDLRYQIGWAQEFCDLIGIPKLVIPKVEADDTIGSVAKWAENQGAQVFVCSSDKDMYQLVSNRVHMLNTHKDNLILDPEGVKEKFGISPKQMIDYLAMVGDASDNVPGLPGFGPKTAAQLLQTFETLENLLENPDQVPGKKKQETLRQESEMGRLSKELVTIDTAVEIPQEPSFYTLGSGDTEKLKTFYAKMGFHSLLKELSETEVQKEAIATNYILVDDEKAFQELLNTLKGAEKICFDTETTHWKPLEAELVGIGFCITPGTAWYVPTNGTLGLKRVLEGVKPLFENRALKFYGHNVKYDWHILKNYHITIANLAFDTILASYVLHSHQRQHSLDALSLHYFGKVKTPISNLIGKGKQAITMREAPLHQVSDYCCEDVDYTTRLYDVFEKELKERKLEKLFYELELPLLTVLGAMERHGIYLEVEKLQHLRKEVIHALEGLEKEIHVVAGEPFNIKSPKQLGDILFVKMLIPPPKKTATGFSTDAEVLEGLKKKYPIAEKVLEFRMLEKLRSTYIEALPSEVNPKTGRIHPNFNQSVAATGRLSCQDPNLQNIPVRTPMGRLIREAFHPEKEGWSFLAADYSQIELRLLAHFSEDPTLLSAFNNDEDIHTHTAATLLGVPVDAVTKEQRYQAKAVNFGIIYGQQAFGLSRELGISIAEASEFIKNYFERYGKVKEFLEACKEKARQTGKAVTLTGRERAIPEIQSKNPRLRQFAERLAVNTPLQGTAADLIKLAMIHLDKKLGNQEKIGYMLLQIHDELILEIPDFEIVDLTSVVKQEMENVFQLKVKLKVDLKVGKNWKEC